MQEVDRSTNRALSELGGAEGCSRGICPNRGVRIVTTPEANRQEKNPRMAAVASIVLPGLGQIYNGETRKGVPLIIVAVLFLYVIITNRTILSEIADFLYLVLLLYAAYDAYSKANEINLDTS